MLRIAEFALGNGPAALMGGPDQLEAVHANLERRAPRFQGPGTVMSPR